jgi:hypothetical protein
MRRLIKFPIIIFLVAGFIFLFSFFVMQLWNWLMPAIFGLHAITYWQALGILVLSKILFGGFRGRPFGGGPPWRRGRHWRERMAARWESMTPEEREKFRQGMRQGVHSVCDWAARATEEPKSS